MLWFPGNERWDATSDSTLLHPAVFGTGTGLALDSVGRLQECWETQMGGTRLWKNGFRSWIKKWSLSHTSSLLCDRLLS